MNIRLSSLAMSALVVAAIGLIPAHSWGVFFPLGPSNNDWGLKYELQVNPANDNVLNVTFKLADGGRLAPVYSVTVVAFSELRSDGGRSYRVKTPIELKKTKDGQLAGQVQIPKEFADIAKIRILTQTLDGRPQTAGARYYDIPLKNFLSTTPVPASSPTPSSAAARSTSKVVK